MERRESVPTSPRVPTVILAAALLVLVGLGLFVGGVVTGVTALYWGCVAVCLAAASLLVIARRRIAAAASGASGDGAPAATEGSGSAPDARSAAAAGSAPVQPGTVPGELSDPPVEDVEVTDLLLVVDLTDEVLVVDERPRYHLAGCAHLSGRVTIPLPVDEARRDGFTPCAVCEPDRNLADRARARKAARGS